MGATYGDPIQIPALLKLRILRRHKCIHAFRVVPGDQGVVHLGLDVEADGVLWVNARDEVEELACERDSAIF